MEQRIDAVRPLFNASEIDKRPWFRPLANLLKQRSMTDMSTLAVIAYPEQNTAAQAAAALGRMQKEYLIDLEDIAWVTKSPEGKMKLHQGTSLSGAGAAGGAMWGFLFGLLFLVPVAGLAIGAASGALAGKLSDFGIDDKWIKEVSESIPPGGSAVFVLARTANAERVVPEMAKYGGKVIQTSLSDEQHKALDEALSAQAA
jgi:uncharacterized membrane protein